MKSFFIILFLVNPLSGLAVKSSDNAIWGKIVSPKQRISGIRYKYYVYFEQDGQSQAYPIEINKEELAKVIEKNLDQKVKIQGEVKEVTLQIDGPNKKILVFIPETVKPLTLSELSINPSDQSFPTSSSKIHFKKEGGYDGGIRINDKAANAMIYTGAAVILGTQIGKMLFKKD
jgi:hypothetical protein